MDQNQIWPTQTMTAIKWLLKSMYSMRAGTEPFYRRKLDRWRNEPADVSERRQLEKLRAIVQHAYVFTAYYRQVFDSAGIKPGMIRTASDLSRLPVLSKRTIRENSAALFARGYSPSNLLRFKTGGSTGKALDLYVTEGVSSLRNEVADWFNEWSGWRVGEPVAFVWGNPVKPGNWKEALRDWAYGPYITLDTMELTDAAIRQFNQEWVRVKPTLLFGHSHSLFRLAQRVRALDLRDIRPRGIVSSSMMLLPHERRVIESVFKCRVFDRYGCEEVSLIAAECEMHGGLHINTEHVIVEFVDASGQPVPDGEQGDIVVTDLLNYAMPLVRYRVEDRGALRLGRCACGRSTPLMHPPAGRVADFLLRKDGTQVAGVSLIENTLTRLIGIDQMQIVQEELDLFRLVVVPGSRWDEQVHRELVQYFLSVFGADVRVEVETCAEIPAEPSGKYRFSICRIGS